MKKIVLLILVIVSLQGCLPTKFDNVSILSISKCELPCWAGIYVGTTSREGALNSIDILAEVASNDILKLDTPWQIFNNSLAFSVYLDTKGVNKKTDGEIYFIQDRAVVVTLSRNLNLTLEDLFKGVGEPEFVISLPPYEGGKYTVIGLYPLKGVAFSSLLESTNLEAKTEVFDLILFDYNYYDELLEIGMFSEGEYDLLETKKIMYSWAGYGRIDQIYPPVTP